MRKLLTVTGVAALVALVGIGVGNLSWGNSAVKGDTPSMMVSPQTIVLEKVGAVTVHTNIPAAAVARDTVTLNDVDALYVWADDCGHLAARFAVADLALQPAEAVVLTLCGVYLDPDAGAFAAEDVVRVK